MKVKRQRITVEELLRRYAAGERDFTYVVIDDLYEQKLFSLKELQDCFEAIAPELIRFPSLNPDVIRSRVENLIKRLEGNPKEGQS